MLICFHFTCLELDVLYQSFFTIPSFWREYVSGPFHFIHQSLNIMVTFSFSVFVEVFSDLSTTPYFSQFSWSIELLMLMTTFLKISWDLFGYCSNLSLDEFMIFFLFLNLFNYFNHTYFAFSFCLILGYSIISSCWLEDLLFIDSIDIYFHCKRQKNPR